MSQIWEINGLSLEFDMDDYNTVHKYKEAFGIMSEEEKQLQKDGDFDDTIKNYCLLYWHLFDNLFGKGTAEKLFDNKLNTRICEEIYERFLEFVKTQINEAAERKSHLMSKYAPVNREARRAKK